MIFRKNRQPLSFAKNHPDPTAEKFKATSFRPYPTNDQNLDRQSGSFLRSVFYENRGTAPAAPEKDRISVQRSRAAARKPASPVFSPGFSRGDKKQPATRIPRRRRPRSHPFRKTFPALSRRTRRGPDQTTGDSRKRRFSKRSSQKTRPERSAPDEPGRDQNARARTPFESRRCLRSIGRCPLSRQRSADSPPARARMVWRYRKNLEKSRSREQPKRKTP